MGFGRGAGFLLQGVRQWRDRPGLMLLGIVPALIVAVLIASLLVTLLFTADDLVDWATPFADDWNQTGQDVFRAALWLLVVGGSGLLAVITFTGLTLAVGDPFYEKIWKETEAAIGGDVPEHGVGWIRGALDGLVLVVFGIVLAIAVFVIGLLPVVGAIVGGTLGFLAAAWALAGELVSRPLEARGLDRSARAALMRPHRRALLGFGIGVQACFLIPFGGILVMPAAVAGATHLARAALEEGARPGW